MRRLSSLLHCSLAKSLYQHQYQQLLTNTNVFNSYHTVSVSYANFSYPIFLSGICKLRLCCTKCNVKHSMQDAEQKYRHSFHFCRHSFCFGASVTMTVVGIAWTLTALLRVDTSCSSKMMQKS